MRTNVAGTRNKTLIGKMRRRQSGQALVEFAAIAIMLFVFVFALIDVSRAIYQEQLMTGLSREGANLASRGTKLSDAAAAVVSESPLDLQKNGKVIVTSVMNQGGAYKITGQSTAGALSATSKVGTGVGSTAVLPSSARSMIAANQTIYVSEVFYSYTAITPIGQFMAIKLPSTLYDAAYF
ncbi:MAG: pilus assembly protein [Acidobacteriaceae bacterium]|nr:pilus assembly protein [Acidobacteriaceae bacterium]